MTLADVAAEDLLSPGNVLTMLSFVAMGAVYVTNSRMAAKVLGERLKGIDTTMIEFKDDLKKLQEVLVAVAVQGARIQTIDDRALATGKRVDYMSHTVGKILLHLAINPDPE